MSEMRAFMEGYYQAYNSGDPDRLAPYYHQEVLLVSAQGELRGREAILDTYRYITERLEDRMTPQHMVVEGDRAAVEILDQFRALVPVADFLGQDRAAGDRFQLQLCGVYRREQGVLTEVRLYHR